MFELYGLRSGMMLAKDSNISKLIIQTDSKYVYTCFHREGQDNGKNNVTSGSGYSCDDKAI